MIASHYMLLASFFDQKFWIRQAEIYRREMEEQEEAEDKEKRKK